MIKDLMISRVPFACSTEDTFTDLKVLVSGILNISPESAAFPVLEDARMKKSKVLREGYIEAIQKKQCKIFVNAPYAEVGAITHVGTLLPTSEHYGGLLEGSGMEDNPQNRNALNGLSVWKSREAIMLHLRAGIPLHQARSMLSPPTQGVQIVNTDGVIYNPSEKIAEAAQSVAKGFTLADWRLRPRGCFLDGRPGAGKTTAAKYIAHMCGLPLYRMDIARMRAKYMGESERQLEEGLRFVEREAPAVLLIDEADKIFSSGDETGVQENMLGQLLWWLQEHRSPVYTMMTCNNIDKVPAELYRPGRLDSVIEVPPVKGEAEIREMVLMFLEKYGASAIEEEKKVLICARLGDEATAASIEQQVVKAIREEI